MVQETKDYAIADMSLAEAGLKRIRVGRRPHARSYAVKEKIRSSKAAERN